MASLSNINGLFDVHSTGAILFSTSHGTSGQILRSNGNAAPTWVAASTVIGGPYLPLTGGTLTGNLAINGSNSLSVGGVTTLNDLDVTDTLAWRVSPTDAARQRADARDDGTTFSRLHWYGRSDNGSTSNFRHAYYDGANYINVTAAAGIITYTGGATFSGLVSGITPTAAANFTTKDYVDNLSPPGGPYLPVANPNFTGTLEGPVFSGDVTASGDGQSNYPFRLGTDYSAYMMAAASNTWGLFWAGNTGARYGTNGLGGPGNIWNNSANPNEFCFVGSDATTWSVWGNVGNTWQAGSLTADGIIYASGGNSTEWNTSYDNSITALAVSGTTTKTLTATQQDGGTLTASWTDNDSNTTWPNVGAGIRTNYTLGFKPPANSYAGFYFQTSDAAGAGYLLVRGESGSGAYTSQGISLIADAGWLSLVSRTTTDKGVRIMAGATATTRMRVESDGFITMGNDTAVNTYTPSQGYVAGISSPTTGGQTYLSLSLGGSALGNTGVAFGLDANGASYYMRDNLPIRFYTNNTFSAQVAANGYLCVNSTLGASRLEVIDSNSIGYYTSTSPYRTATFQGNGNTSIAIAANGNYDGLYSELRLGNVHNTYSNFSPYIRAVQGAGINTYSLEFGTSDTGGAASTAMTIGGRTGTVKGNIGIGTTLPAASAKLTLMGNQTFGLPGNGTNTSGRFISIEGNTDGSGEGSSRIFFTEHNSTTGAMDKYGMSLGYRGGATSIVGASGNTWTGLTQIGNGEWGMWGHNNNATGSLVMFGDRAATYVSIPSRVGINNTSPDAYLRVDGTTSVTAARFYGTGGTRPPLELRQNNTAGWFAKFYSDNFGTYVGGISFYGSSTTFNTSSDYRLKENIIPISDSITRLKQLKPSRFNFKQYPETTIDGFLAHEVQDIVPEAVTGNKDELDSSGKPVYQAIDHSKLVPLLVAAIQELEARVKELENK